MSLNLVEIWPFVTLFSLPPSPYHLRYHVVKYSPLSISSLFIGTTPTSSLSHRYQAHCIGRHEVPDALPDKTRFVEPRCILIDGRD